MQVSSLQTKGAAMRPVLLVIGVVSAVTLLLVAGLVAMAPNGYSAQFLTEQQQTFYGNTAWGWKLRTEYRPVRTVRNDANNGIYVVMRRCGDKVSVQVCDRRPPALNDPELWIDVMTGRVNRLVGRGTTEENRAPYLHCWLSSDLQDFGSLTPAQRAQTRATFSSLFKVMFDQKALEANQLPGAPGWTCERAGRRR